MVPLLGTCLLSFAAPPGPLGWLPFGSGPSAPQLCLQHLSSPIPRHAELCSAPQHRMAQPELCRLCCQSLFFSAPQLFPSETCLWPSGADRLLAPLPPQQMTLQQSLPPSPHSSSPRCCSSGTCWDGCLCREMGWEASRARKDLAPARQQREAKRLRWF